MNQKREYKFMIKYKIFITFSSAHLLLLSDDDEENNTKHVSVERKKKKFFFLFLKAKNRYILRSPS